MNRLAAIINSLNYRDLKAIEKDLYEGNIGKLIKQNLNKIESISPKTCATCGTELKKPAYVLEFGRQDFRKRASFCGLDCLSFFTSKLSAEKKLHHNHQKSI